MPSTAGPLWAEVTLFLGAVVLLDAPGSDFWMCYRARSETRTPLFSQDDGLKSVWKRVQWLILRRRMLPRATWFMASETSMRAS